MKFTPYKTIQELNKSPQINCAGCTKCCKNRTLVIITEHDKQNFYDTEKISLPDGRIFDALKFQTNGDCIYLIDNKCSIYGQHPLICRAFSCIDEFRSYSRNERRLLIKQGMLNAEIIEEGRKRSK